MQTLRIFLGENNVDRSGKKKPINVFFGKVPNFWHDSSNDKAREGAEYIVMYMYTRV